MRPDVKKDLLSVFEKSIESISKKDYVSLLETSNMVIHNASVYQDDLSVGAAVLIYASSKLLKHDPDFARDNLLELFELMILSLQRDDLRALRNLYKKMSTKIRQEDKVFNKYARPVIDDADLKKATKIYDHGISLKQAAKILNVSEWELLDYLGGSQTIHDADIDNTREYVKDKLDYVRELFK